MIEALNTDALTTALNPGSRQAVATGCTCDPEANFHGAGEVIPPGEDSMKERRRFYIKLYCPQHSDFTPLGK